MTAKIKDKTLYTVQLTEEQISLIRTFHVRMEQMYVHHGVSELVQETGEVERVTFWRCYFCDKGSYTGIADIPHNKKCIIPLAHAEFWKMNGQFVDVLNKEPVS